MHLCPMECRGRKNQEIKGTSPDPLPPSGSKKGGGAGHATVATSVAMLEVAKAPAQLRLRADAILINYGEGSPCYRPADRCRSWGSNANANANRSGRRATRSGIPDSSGPTAHPSAHRDARRYSVASARRCDVEVYQRSYLPASYSSDWL